MSQTREENPAITNSEAFGPMRELFLTLPRIQATAVSILLKQQKEMFEFLSHRCALDLEFVDRLSHVGDASKLPDLWSQFVQGASRDYADEARKCVNAGSRSATELADQLKEIQSEATKAAA